MCVILYIYMQLHNYMGIKSWCDYCRNFMWGLRNQGYKCKGQLPLATCFEVCIIIVIPFPQQTVAIMSTNSVRMRLD